jgi:hypothetical protein
MGPVSINEKDTRNLTIFQAVEWKHFHYIHENTSAVIHPVGWCAACQSSGTLSDLGKYSLVWIYQHGWARHSGSTEGEHSCYEWFVKASINFVHIFVPSAF